MKILYLAGSTIPSHKANSVHVMHMCHELANLGHEVHLVANVVDREKAHETYGVEANFKLINVPNASGALKYLMKLGSVFHAIFWRPDLIYGRDSVSIFFHSFLGIPFALEVHEPAQSRWRQKIQGYLFKNAKLKKLIVITHQLKIHFVKERGLIDSAKVEVVPDAASGWKTKAGMSLKKEHYHIQSKPRVGYVGNLYKGKGIELILEIANLLPEFEFGIVGGSEKEIEKWKSQTKATNICFFGKIDHKEVGQAVLDRFDILVAPFQKKVFGSSENTDIARWNSPLKVFEYMSLAIPFVCSNLVSLREVVDEQICLVAEPDDSGEWAEQLVLMAGDINLRRSLGTEAYRRFTKQYTWQQRAKKILEECSQ